MNDIVALLKNIKNNIKAIENENFDDKLLLCVKNDFLEFLELVKLFLISERGSYYGYVFMNLSFEVDFNSKSVAGIKLNIYPPVFSSNPLLLCKFSLKEIMFIICHELDHIVFNHPTEMVKLNPTKDQQVFELFNLSADASVNDRIINEIKTEKHKFLKAPDGLITSNFLASHFKIKKLASLENYSYYFEILKKYYKDDGSIPNEKTLIMTEMQQNEIAENKGNSQGDSQSGVDDSNLQDNGKIVTSKNCKDFQDHNWEQSDDAEEINENVKELLNKSFEMMNSETRGLVSSDFIFQIEKINEPPILSWQKILKKYIGTISANKKKTKTRLNRRQPERFDLSGQVDNKILKIVVAIDTSGSVDNEMIAHIFNEIFDILAKRKFEITIIECDAKINRVYTAKNRDDVQLKVRGRGGTMFTPVIDYVNKYKKFRDALLIYFTDGYGEDKIPKPKTYRNIWVVFGGKDNLSVEEPYGIVLGM